MPLEILQIARDGWTRKSWPREVLISVALAAAYVAAAKIGFRAALVAEQVSPLKGLQRVASTYIEVGYRTVVEADRDNPWDIWAAPT